MSERMSKADELRALADQCEREEGSLLLDYDIHHAMAARKAESIPSSYTTSLDAAVTLVPENEWWEVYVEKDWSQHARAQIDIAVLIITGFGKTPALAICAAALRARAALLAEGDGT